MSKSTLSLPHRKHVLSNGLEVVLHQDRRNPLVSVYLYYHVGSSREGPGKTGFAHLFEHMLFQGSEHVPGGDHFRLIQEAGGTLNGTTNQDRTNYFETLPASELELALWLESDRMGFLLPAMTQEKLDNQRDVVMNERRQTYENRPYGLVHETLLRSIYAAGHPYSWPTIGSMEDIAGATLDDVAAFFRRWYGPNNATLAIGGDFDEIEALRLVERYFGPIPRGPAVERPAPEPARLSSSVRVVLEDRIQQPQLTLAWPTVEARHEHETRVDLLADVLSANRSSLLDDALMAREELAGHVSIGHLANERAGILVLNLRPMPGVTLDALEQRTHELLRAFVSDGVDAERLERLKTRRIGWMVRGLETVAARTNRLGHDNCFTGRPDRVQEDLDLVRAVTADELVELARELLVDAPHVALSTVPAGRRELAAGARAAPAAPVGPPVDRSSRPASGPEHPFRSPDLWRGQLANGISVAGTLLDHLPLTHVALSLPGGRHAQPANRLGIAELTARMLDEGTRELSGAELVDSLDGLGAELRVMISDDTLRLALSVLTENLAPSVRLLADLLETPRFAGDDFGRVRRQHLLDLDTEVDRPREIAYDAFHRLVLGPAARGVPLLGHRDVIEGATLDEVREYFTGATGTAGARLAVVGGLAPDGVEQACAALAAWTGSGAMVSAAEVEAGTSSPPAIYLVDQPGAEQSELRVGHRGIARNDPDWFPAYALNFVLGGSFSSRINLNLREDKGYTYGAKSSFDGGATAGTFCVATAVETDVTAAALGEILYELRYVHTGITGPEADFARRSITQSLSGAFESGGSRLAMVEAIEKYGWPDDYPERRLAWLKTLDASMLDELARRLVRPDELVVLVVGDRARVEADLVGLGLGDVVVLERGFWQGTERLPAGALGAS